MKRTLMRTGAVLGATIGMLLVPSLAEAQTTSFGQQGQFIVSAERLFSPFFYQRVSEDAVNPPAGTSGNVVTTQTGISLLWGSASRVGSAEHAALPEDLFYTTPRIGFDYVIVPNVTVGGNIGLFVTLGGESQTTTTMNNVTNTVNGDQPKTTIFGVAPRAGYILGINNLFSVWLRGGLSYFTGTASATVQNGTQSAEAHQFALDLDPQLVITPIPHLGFTAGLTTDIPLAGGHSLDNEPNGGGSQNFSASAHLFYIGLTVGMLGYF